MSRTRPTSRVGLARLIILAVVGWALVALRSRSRDDVAAEIFTPLADPPAASESESRSRRDHVRGRTRRGRLATSLAFATLFFAGAALSAGAGDAIVGALEGATTTGETTTAETTTEPDPSLGEGEGDAGAPPEAEAEIPPSEEGSTQEPSPAPEAPATDGESPVEGETPAAPPAGEQPAEPEDATPTPATSPPEAPPAPGAPPAAPEAPQAGGKTPAPASGGTTAPATDGPPLLAPHAHTFDAESRAVDPEAEALGGFATIWLHRGLPDPTPPAKRLAPAFAKLLRQEASRARIGWSTLLGALRADGRGGRSPAGRTLLRSMATRLSARAGSGEWQAFLALRGRTAYADRAQALARYNRAVGLRALVVGLDASKETLEERVLADTRLDIYGGGRSDILAGRIDVRVLVLLRYLAEAHEQVTVSSLHSGHRIYSRPGVVSAHTYGLAVDIAALGGRSIMGNSQPGGLTETAVRNILLLPAELRPQQVISLLGLGGPSFPLANHADHIHAGF